jgi:16S rRNA (cytosine1402-N4)-methyltransferase
VNRELDALAAALPQAHGLLGIGARIAVLSYHSLEDRIVKEYLRRESRDCICEPGLPECRCGHRASLRLVTHGALKPSLSEIERNPRARSARLRAAERIAA